MNKSYFSELADYNIWANEIIQNWLKAITIAQWSAPIVSSFGNIEATALHIAAAETIWLERLLQVKSPVWLSYQTNPNRDETVRIWTGASLNLKTYVHDMDESHLQTMLNFKRRNGEENSMKIYQILAHVFNHSTYHRGQILTMLRQLGFNEVSGTDMLLFFQSRHMKV